MNEQDLCYNFYAGLYNTNLVTKAKALLRTFLEDSSSTIVIKNPDGSSLKLQHGFDIISVTGFDIIKED